MHRPDPNEVRVKLARIRGLLDARGLDALLLGRRDNFAWLTGGGSNAVVLSSELGFGLLLVSRDSLRLIAREMDCRRIREEELAGLEVEEVPLKWHEPDLLETAAAMLKGTRGALSDIPAAGTHHDLKAIYALHYPLTAREMERCRSVGAKSDEIFSDAAREARPGMSERELETMLLEAYAREGMDVDVLLVGSDERIGRYRHPTPGEKKIGRVLMMHGGVRKWGLHANVSRMVCFGDPIPDDLRRRYDAASLIEAACLSRCVPGTRFSEILSMQKELYRELGYPDEWERHFPGGITGYLLADATLSRDVHAVVAAEQAYDWFITITGVKVEELSVNTGGTREVLSATGAWPLKEYRHGDFAARFPDILIR